MQHVIEAGRAAQAAGLRLRGPFNPFGPQIKRLVGWWGSLLPLVLTEEERAAAAALSVFGGSFTEEGARAVGAGLAGQGISTLVLLSVLEDASASTGGCCGCQHGAVCGRRRHWLLRFI